MLNLAWPGESKETIHQTASEKVQIRNGKSAGVDQTFGYSCRMTGNFEVMGWSPFATAVWKG